MLGTGRILTQYSGPTL